MRKKGWERGEVAFMLHFIPKPMLLRSPFMSTPHIHTHTHTQALGRASWRNPLMRRQDTVGNKPGREPQTKTHQRHAHEHPHTHTHIHSFNPRTQAKAAERLASES